MKPDLVILCGGRGLRLGKLAEGLPKPMVETDGVPFLKILVSDALRQGMRRIIFCTGYRGDVIENYFSKVAEAQFIFSHEREALGTAGAIKLAESKIQAREFIAINGDSYCEVDYAALLDFHRKKAAAASVVVTAARDRRDGGYVRTDKTGAIQAFNEKEFSPDAFINAGIYIFNKNLLERVPAGQSVSLEKDFLPGLIGDKLYGYESGNPLYDIGTPERLESFKNDIKTRRFIHQSR